MNALPDRIDALLRKYDTLVLATADASGQPEATAIFFAPQPTPAGLEIVCTLLSRSGKLAMLRENPRTGFFVGPHAPTCWLQGMGDARIVEEDEERSERVSQLIAAAPGAAVFIERVPITPVVIAVRRLKLTDLTGAQPPIIEWSAES